MRTAILVAVLTALVSSTSCTGKPASNTPRAFFAERFAGYWIACSRGEPQQPCELPEDKRAGLTPALLERVLAVGVAYPDRAKVQAAAAELNTALEAAAVPVVIDVQPFRDQTLLLAYEIVSRRTWSSEGKPTIPILRVHRLDKTNIVATWLGHAGRAEPLVLLDRIEVQLLDNLRGQSEKDGNTVDKAVQKTWRALAEKATNPTAIEAAITALAKRDELHKKLEDSFSTRVNIPYPERLLLGEDYFERVEPYADPKRNGGPLFMRNDLKALRAADRALAEESVFAALTTLRDLEASATEAHEVHHAVHGSTDPSLVPQDIMEALGDDDLKFGVAADGELKAYLGELRDGEAPPCLALGRVARILAGQRSSSTPHHYAARVLFKTMRGEWLTSTEAVAKSVEELCALDDATLRAMAGDAWKALYKEPMPAVARK